MLGVRAPIAKDMARHDAVIRAAAVYGIEDSWMRALSARMTLLF
jgi:hypothetical protein